MDYTGLISYENYYRLMNNLLPETRAVGLFDAQGQRSWPRGDTSNEAIQLLSEHVSSQQIKRGMTNAIPFEWQQLESGETIFSLNLENTIDEDTLRLVVLVQITMTSSATEMGVVRNKLDAFGKCLLNERNLDRELESMADELSVRYEELNLVYKTENQSINPYHTQESLRRLVANCVEFLGTGMVALSLPDKNINIYEFDGLGEITATPKLLASLKGTFYEKLRQQQLPIVINNPQDAMRYELITDRSYKLLLSPIINENTDVIGMLSTVNASHGPDFSNSDRNLLDVMAKKITKIIQTNFDDLTGLENERSFETSVNNAIVSSRGTGSEHALLNVDIDHINVINDIAGRQAGDEVIKLVGQSLSSLVRSHDSVARLGADKFGIILENCPLHTAQDMANRISQLLESLDFHWQGQQYDLSACIGVAPITVESNSLAAVMSSVEAARNAAKKQGTKHIQVYQQNDHDLLRRKHEMHCVARIQSALRDNHFQLFSQLIQGFGSNADKSHFEILLRMHDKQGKLVSPADFMPAAEHYNLMPDLDRWVIRHTIDQALAMADRLQRFPCQLSINLSGQSLGDKNFEAYVWQQLERLGPDVKHICFEITESAAIANLNEAKEFMSRAKSMGCKFSLDDFGTGLSSFSYLQNMQVDYLKIDGSFVRNILTDPVSEAMVSAINQVGHVMQLQTIAEYVEDRDIARRLTDIGIDYGQGYGLGKPQPLQESLETLVQDNKVAYG